MDRDGPGTFGFFHFVPSLFVNDPFHSLISYVLKNIVNFPYILFVFLLNNYSVKSLLQFKKRSFLQKFVRKKTIVF